MGTASDLIPKLYSLPGFYEPFSAISHLCGAAVFLILGALLLRRGRGNGERLIYLGVYAFSCVFLLAMSGVYHMMVRGGTARLVMERLDHGAIFILIAGTFTPAHGILFRGPPRWAPLCVIWSAAIAGITFKVIFFNSFPEWLGLAIYLTMGWFGTLAGVLLARRYGFAFIAPLLAGGVAYTIGGLIDMFKWPYLIAGLVHPHEVFHLAVLTGMCCHWLFVWQFAGGPPAGDEGERLSPTKTD